jgi:hypothetical protein
MGWASFWATFSQTHLVTLLRIELVFTRKMIVMCYNFVVRANACNRFVVQGKAIDKT